MTGSSIRGQEKAINNGVTTQLPTEALLGLGSGEEQDDRRRPVAVLPAGRHLAADLAVGLRDKTWMALAKCKNTEPSLFFSHDEVRVREAQQVCATCPVRLACLACALDNNLSDGVWGGTSEQERRRVVSVRRDRSRAAQDEIHLVRGRSVS